MKTELMAVGLALVIALWDAARRYIAARKYNAAIWERIEAMERAAEDRFQKIERSEAQHLQELKALVSSIQNAARGGPPRLMRRS